MGKVILTNVREKERIQELQVKREGNKESWEFIRTSSLVQALHTAKDMGWKYNKVQVRVEKISDTEREYLVEPYEEGCGCKGILKYNQYFN